MKKILVPTDFSEASKNAARYAVQAAASTEQPSQIILYNVYDKISAGSDGSPLRENEENRKTILDQALKNYREELLELANADIRFFTEEGSSLVENMCKYVRHNSIDLVVMGITGATRLEQIFMGSNTLSFVNEGICPVIIVPPHAVFTKIEDVMFLSDFKNVEQTTPVSTIMNILDLFKPVLHIVNVDSEHYVELTEEYKREREKLERMFSDYSPEFAFIRLYDFLDAVSSFAHDRSIDLIITVPRKHSFLQGLFTTSHTRKLAYHSHVPILAVHD